MHADFRLHHKSSSCWVPFPIGIHTFNMRCGWNQVKAKIGPIYLLWIHMVSQFFFVFPFFHHFFSSLLPRCTEVYKAYLLPQLFIIFYLSQVHLGPVTNVNEFEEFHRHTLIENEYFISDFTLQELKLLRIKTRDQRGSDLNSSKTPSSKSQHSLNSLTLFTNTCRNLVGILD